MIYRTLTMINLVPSFLKDEYCVQDVDTIDKRKEIFDKIWDSGNKVIIDEEKYEDFRKYLYKNNYVPLKDYVNRNREYTFVNDNVYSFVKLKYGK